MDMMRPLHYHIRIDTDLDRFRFSGTATIRFHADRPSRYILLNSLELAVWKVISQEDRGDTPCSFRIDPEKETVAIDLPGERTGEINLRIEYEGLINDRMAGFYRSRYTGDDGGPRYMAVTQFQESDARRAFPCIDHPGVKSVFEVELICDAHLTAVSNTAIQKETGLENDRKRVVFEATPPMSTYLVFFGVAEFDALQDSTDRRIRALAVPKAATYAEFGLEFTRQALQFCEQYYDLPYPLSKLDVIAVPDFAFGAMENWGAITFRENLLLLYPGTTSSAGKERICEVIAHEIAHQWFGNLVTPNDWTFLWLNESFATYFGFGVVDHYYPEWHIWDQFIHTQTEAALKRDALQETFSIEIPGGEHVVINTSTAPIIYSKGGSILRQLEGFIGHDDFQKGLRHYLESHAYGNASSRHLWEAFENISQLPITRMMKSWIEQPGYPMIEVQRDGHLLAITQNRFSYLPGSAESTWQVPVTVRVFPESGDPFDAQMLLDGQHGTIDIGDHVAAYKINPEHTGFYRVLYRDPVNIEALGARVLTKELPEIDRWGLQNDLHALFCSGLVPLDEYLSFLRVYHDEDAFLPLISLTSNLFGTFLIADQSAQKRIGAAALAMVEGALARIGYEPDDGESHGTSNLRDQILFQAVLYGSKDAEKRTRTLFDQLTSGSPVHPDILKSIMQSGALFGDGETFDWFEDRLRSTDSEHERLQITSAIGCFRESSLIERALEFTLGTIPDRNKFIPIVAMAANPYAMPHLWTWYTANLERIEAFHPLLYERVVAALIPVCGLDRYDELVDYFNRYMQEKDLARDVIKLSLEKLEINRRIRERLMDAYPDPGM
ncbi:Leucyl aminopeptidase (EC [Olavius algarvensis associated proteobacterium Delta 3]|nr:Leucyl aminopeptidase (EC [Olavius algarvensis associated proteobacterium Delta 3]CAB5169446.1 Leucyl aminopeptidase (EC [Olavius algarvensis associated proteobacterium Delta 3]